MEQLFICLFIESKMKRVLFKKTRFQKDCTKVHRRTLTTKRHQQEMMLSEFQNYTSGCLALCRSPCVKVKTKTKTIKHNAENNLEQSGGIGNVISHSALSSNPNLILVYRCFCPWLLHPLVPIHLLFTGSKPNQKKKPRLTDKKILPEKICILFPGFIH